MTTLINEQMNKEVNILGTIFKEKNRKVKFDDFSREKIMEFGYEYWDDPNFPGCGGYTNDGRWKEISKKIIDFFEIREHSKILDVCCGKGFLLTELLNYDQTLDVYGIDISQYAIEHADETIKSKLLVASGAKIPYPDSYFDLTICLNSLYIMTIEDCVSCLKEINRTSKNSFIQVNSYRNLREKENLMKWDASARLVLSTKEWEALFKEANYNGYYYWTIFL